MVKIKPLRVQATSKNKIMVPRLHLKVHVIKYPRILQQYHFAATNQGRRRLLKSGMALERRFPSVDGSG